MQHASSFPVPEREIAELRQRSGALRQSAALPGAQLPQLLDAALAELDGAIDAAVKLQAGSGLSAAQGLDHASADLERRLLRAMFQDAPVPLFVLDRDGTIRRANKRAGELLGSGSGYATGKLFTAFVALPSRAAVHSQVAAVARTGKPRRVPCPLLSADGVLQAVLALHLIDLAGEPGLLIAAASMVPGGPAAEAVAAETAAAPPGDSAADPETAAAPPGDSAADPGDSAADPAGRPDPAAAGTGAAVRAVEAMAHRLDLVTAATRLLLENATFSESVTLQRCARLLSGELAAWVIVDVERRSRLRRQVVIGPADHESEQLARRVTAIDPPPGSAPRQVHESGSSMLVAHAEDVGILGSGADDVPLLMQLGATSVLCVPLTDGEQTYGVLTLARQPSERHFEFADLGLVEELGEQLALAIRVDRMLRRRTEIADSLQASLLPRALPEIPGVEIAAAYVAATEGLDVGGDFYDVYRTPGGWGVAIGDVCGKGEEAAAVTAAARHAIRVLAHWNRDPAEVLRQANELMLAEEYDGRFVTACAAHFSWRDDSLLVTVASAGHPGPVLIRPDGRVRMLNGGGMPLGLFPDAEPGTQDVELSQGDLLFLFTDGVTEARSPEMAYFEDRLTDELAALAGRPPAEIIGAMQALVVEFSMDELRDDMTMLALRVGGAPAT
jgi:serine phosphatase RsbU (regulator of sigma subunit)/PAS domain-containing protein